MKKYYRVAKLVNVKKKNEELFFYYNYEKLNFKAKRFYFIKNFNSKSIRGNHAHKKTKQIFICVKGFLTITLSNKIKKLASIKLNEKNNKILFIMRPTWLKLENFSKDCIVMILADREYKSSDVVYDQTLIS
jgi:dTDP-4-dehydrorhamnose 3,5-epimerase-like enzyme